MCEAGCISALSVGACKVLLVVGSILARNHALLRSRELEERGHNNPGELISCDILMNQVVEMQRSPKLPDSGSASSCLDPDWLGDRGQMAFTAMNDV